MNIYDLSAESLFKITAESKKIYQKLTNEKFPLNPKTQIIEVLKKIYNEFENTNIIFKEMIYLNYNKPVIIGKIYSRNKNTGENNINGIINKNKLKNEVEKEYNIDNLLKNNTYIYLLLDKYCKMLERKLKNIVKIKFLIEEKQIFITDIEIANVKPLAKLISQIDMYEEKIITEDDIIRNISSKDLKNAMYSFDKSSIEGSSLLSVNNYSLPVISSGKIVLSKEEAISNYNKNIDVILIKEKISIEDLKIIEYVKGIITKENNEYYKDYIEELNKSYIFTKDIKIDKKNKIVKINGKIIEEGSYLTIGGIEGSIFEGRIEKDNTLINSKISVLTNIINKIKNTKVITKTNNINHIKKCLDNSDGILYDINNTLFDKEIIETIQKSLLVEKEEISELFKIIIDYYIKKFTELFEIAKDKDIYIKLLDIPLRSFIPEYNKNIYELSKKLNIEPDKLKYKLMFLDKSTPVLDNHGCLFLLEYKEILKIQIESLFNAKAIASKKGYELSPNIIIPNTNNIDEIIKIKKIISVIEKLIVKSNLNYKIGTILESPRDIVLSNKISKHLDFLIIDTNKLTINTYGKNNLNEPLTTIDKEGVGKLMKVSTKLIDKTKLITYGNHNLDEESVKYFNAININNIIIPYTKINQAYLAILRSEENGNK